MRCPATSPTGWTCSTATRRPRSRPTVLAREVARASSSSSAIATSRTRATTTTAATARRRKSTSGARKIRSSARLPISFRPALPSRSSKRCARLSATRSRKPSRRPRASRIRVLRTRRRTCTPRTIRFRMERAPSTAALVVALVLLLGACTAANPSASPTPAPTRDPNALNVTALLDLSGSRAPNGGPQRDALQLWADQHSTATPRVRLKIVDVASSPSRTALELRRAAVEDRADAIVVGVSVDYDDALAAAVQLAQVPVLFTLPIPEPATRGGGWAFALAPTPGQLARFVLDDAALRSVLSADLVVSDDSTTAIVERIALTNELSRRRVTANVVTVNPGDATAKLRPLLG